MKSDSTSSSGSAKENNDSNGKAIPRHNMKLFQTYLPQNERIYRCAGCRADLAYHSELISKVSVFLCAEFAR